jgi:hypothetical protein
MSGRFSGKEHCLLEIFPSYIALSIVEAADDHLEKTPQVSGGNVVSISVADSRRKT